MRITCFVLWFFAALIAIPSLAKELPSKPDKKKKYLFKLGDEKYFTEEFEYYFQKNSRDMSPDSTKILVQEYLDLYVKFRLKVLEAKKLGMDQTDDFKQEFEGYQKQLAKPYLTESQISEKLVAEAYDRLQEEILASHILINVEEDALPEDTLKAYNRLIDIKTRVENGEDFESFAYQISEDPSAKKNKGSLGYFTALRMVYPFENAAYNVDKGELAGPVRTKFGYHLIWVKEKRPARGKMKAAHIMIRIEKLAKDDPDQAEKKIRSIYEKLKAGEDWNELCKAYSEDFNTKNSGGELRWFGTGDLIKEFEDAAYGIDALEEIAPPVKTKFGWHIIKLLDKKTTAPLAEMRSDLESKISRDSRSKKTKEKALQSLKVQNTFRLDSIALSRAFEVFDSTLLMGQWPISRANINGENTLFTITSTTYKVLDFWHYVAKNQRKRSNANLADYQTQLYKKFESESVLGYEESQLEATNPEYRYLLEEYRSGILLFNLMEEKVWAKAAKDTVGLLSFYERNIQDYQHPESADIRMFTSSKESTIKQAMQYLETSKKEIDEVFNKEDPLHLQVVDKQIDKNEDTRIDDYWSVGTHQFSQGGLYYIVKVKSINPAGTQKLDKIKGLVISDYQEELEKEWVDELKEKYSLKVNKGVLNAFIKKTTQNK